MRRASKNEEREKKERKGKGRKEKGRKEKKGEDVCCSEIEEDEGRRRREKTIFPELGLLLLSIVRFNIVVCRSFFFFLRFSTTPIGLWFFFFEIVVWVFWLRN